MTVIFCFVCVQSEATNQGCNPGERLPQEPGRHTGPRDCGLYVREVCPKRSLHHQGRGAGTTCLRGCWSVYCPTYTHTSSPSSPPPQTAHTHTQAPKHHVDDDYRHLFCIAPEALRQAKSSRGSASRNVTLCIMQGLLSSENHSLLEREGKNNNPKTHPKNNNNNKKTPAVLHRMIWACQEGCFWFCISCASFCA